MGGLCCGKTFCRRPGNRFYSSLTERLHRLMTVSVFFPDCLRFDGVSLARQ